jgi:hypothetical protein
MKFRSEQVILAFIIGVVLWLLLSEFSSHTAPSKADSPRQAAESGKLPPPPLLGVEGPSSVTPIADTPDDTDTSAASLSVLTVVVSAGETGDLISSAEIAGVEIGQKFSTADLHRRTDDAGEVNLDAAYLARIDRLVATAPGYIRKVVPVSRGVAESGERLPVTLERGATLTGRVVDDHGVPIARARVWACRVENRAAWPNGMPEMDTSELGAGASANTDANGSYQIQGLLESGEYVLRAAKSLYSSTSDHLIRVQPGGNAPDIVLNAMAQIRFRVVDAVTGSPVAIATARAKTPRGLVVRRVTARALRQVGKTYALPEEGQVVFQFVRHGLGTHQISKRDSEYLFFAPGYERQLVTSRAIPGRTQEVEVRLSPLSTNTTRIQLRVAVTTRGDQPYSGLAEVNVRDAHGTSVRRQVVLEGPEGAIVAALPPGEYEVSARPSGADGVWVQRAADEKKVSVSADVAKGTAVNCALRWPFGIASLKVEYPSGSAVGGYDVYLAPKGEMGLRVSEWHLRYIAERGLRPDAIGQLLLPIGSSTITVIGPTGKATSVQIEDSGGERSQAGPRMIELELD